jgi:Secretion system C-terminal sorting domain
MEFKYIYINAIFKILFISTIGAQSVFSRINTSGSSFSNSNGSISTSVGEIYANLDLKNGESLNAYFLQPLEKVIVSAKCANVNIVHIVPNPVVKFLQIIGNGLLINKYVILSSNGAVIQSSTFQEEQPIDISNLADGTYFIQLFGENNVFFRTLKFIKIN